MNTCPNCWCWVCDEKIDKCVDWDTHCVCDGSPEWAVERAKVKRRNENAAKQAANGQAPAPAASDDQVNARYAKPTSHSILVA